MEWRDVTDTFTETERHYKNTHLEQDEVLGDTLELSVFSAIDDDYEIYFSYGRFYGIVYAKEEEAWSVRDRMKEELTKAFMEATEPTDTFIDYFSKKYKAELPIDIYFDFDLEKMCEQMDDAFMD